MATDIKPETIEEGTEKILEENERFQEELKALIKEANELLIQLNNKNNSIESLKDKVENKINQLKEENRKQETNRVEEKEKIIEGKEPPKDSMWISPDRLERRLKNKEHPSKLKQALLRPFQFDQEIFDESLNSREEALRESYERGGSRALLFEFLTQKRIKTKGGFFKIKESFDDYLEDKLANWASNKGVKTRKTIWEIAERRSIKKKKKKSAGIFTTAAVVLLKNLANTIGEKIEQGLEIIKDNTLGRASRSRAWKWTVNKTTRIKQSVADSRLIGGVKKVGSGIKNAYIATSTAIGSSVPAKVVKTGYKYTKTGLKYGYKGLKFTYTGAGKVLRTVNGTVKLAGRVGGGIFQGAKSGAYVLLATGGNIPLAIVAGTGSSLLTFGQKLLEGKRFNLFGEKNIVNKLQNRLFIDPRFRTPTGTIDWNKMRRYNAFSKGKSGFRPFYRRLSSLGAGVRWGSSMSLIGSGIGLLLGGGVGSSIGGLIGFGAGAIGGAVGSSLKLNLRTSSGFYKTLSAIPTFEIIGNIQTNLWLASEIDLIMKKYKGNIGKYLEENYFSGDKNKSSFMNFMNITTNWLNLSFGLYQSVSQGALNQATLKLLQSFGKQGILERFLRPVAGGGFRFTRGFTLGNIGSNLIGSALALSMLSLFGMPIGAGAIIGVTIGSAIGNVLGKVVGGLVAGALASTVVGATIAAAVGYITNVIVNSIVSAIGGFIGSLFDKAVKNISESVSIAFNALSAFLGLLSLIRSKFDSDNAIMLIISLIGIFQAFDKMGYFENANQCTSSGNCPAPNQSNLMNPKIYYLENYGIGIINNTALSENQRDLIYSFIDKQSDMLKTKFPNKNILLNLNSDDSYESDTIVVIGIDKDKYISVDEIIGDINTKFLNLSQVNNFIIN